MANRDYYPEPGCVERVAHASLATATMAARQVNPTTVQVLQQRLAKAVDRLISIRGRQDALADRIYGAPPQGNASSTAAPIAPGQMGEVFALIDSLEAQIGYVQESTERLEQIA